MKEKKNFFLNYLKDTFYSKKEKPKITIENGSSSNYQNDNKDNINFSQNEEKKEIKEIKEKPLFENFISEIQNYDYTKKNNLDIEVRNYSLFKEKKENIVKSTELKQLDFKNPITFLDKEFLQEKFNPKLLEKELIDIITKTNSEDDNINDNNRIIYIETIIDRKETLDLYKRVLKYYLDYYCISNGEILYPPMIKIRYLTKMTDIYYDRIHSVKKEILRLKQYNLDNSINLLVKRKKMENIFKLYSLVKNQILLLYNGYKELQLEKMNYDFLSYYQAINKFKDEVEKIDKFVKNKLNKENNGFERNIKKLKIIEEIKLKLNDKKEKFNNKINEEIDNIFDSKKSYIFQLYYLFDIFNTKQNENSKNENHISFVYKMKNNFKKKSKIIILETLQNIYNLQNEGKNLKFIYNKNNPKLSSINKIVINEKFLINYFISIFVKLKSLLDIFLYYYNLINSKNDIEKEYENFKEEVKSEKNVFYEMLDKQISKTIILITNLALTNDDESLSISKNNVFYIINLVCLFEKLLKIKFNVKYNKFINLAIKNFLINYFKLENKKVFEKSIFLLSTDNFEKKLLDTSIFEINSIKEEIPFYFKRFASFFNESEIKESWISKMINKDNIDDIFNSIINNEEYNGNNVDVNNKNFDEIIILFINEEEKEIYKKEIEKENNLIIFNSPLKQKSSYISNSSFEIINGIKEQIINIIIFESLVYDIFNNLFDTIDIYIFVILKIFLEISKYGEVFLVNFNINDLENYMENMEYLSKIIFFQKRYLEVKKFYNSSKNKLKKYYDEEANINGEKGNNFYENLISGLNLKKYNKILNERKVSSKEEQEKIQSKINAEEIKENEKNDDDLNDEGDIETLNINEMNENDNQKNFENNIDNKEKKLFDFFLGDDSNNKNTNNIEITSEEIINEKKITSIKKVIILISTILTIKKILKRLISFSSKIELEIELYEVFTKINKYEKLIEQIQGLFYQEISFNLFNFSQISHLIRNYDWSPSEEEGSQKLFEASNWVNKLKIYFETFVNEIYNKLNTLLGEKKLSEFFRSLLNFIITLIRACLSNIKKCNEMGRSIMLKDIKLLKEEFENILKKNGLDKEIKIENIFDVIIQYANAWYYNSDELYQYIFNFNLDYKCFDNIFNSSPILQKLANVNKNDFLKKVNQNYLNKIKKILSDLN